LTKPSKKTAKFVKPNQIPEAILGRDSEISENNNKLWMMKKFKNNLSQLVVTGANTLIDWLC
jgi:hypothetical protein